MQEVKNVEELVKRMCEPAIQNALAVMKTAGTAEESLREMCRQPIEDALCILEMAEAAETAIKAIEEQEEEKLIAAFFAEGNRIDAFAKEAQ